MTIDDSGVFLRMLNGILHEEYDVRMATSCQKALVSICEKKPDLILMTGDNIYGEFDDSGASLRKLIAYMDSFQIPWAPVWGNHDNESTKGVTWQCEQFEKAQKIRNGK